MFHEFHSEPPTIECRQSTRPQPSVVPREYGTAAGGGRFGTASPFAQKRVGILRLVDVTIGWQNFAEMTIDTSSILSVASVRCPHKIELAVSIGLSFALQKNGVEVFEKLRERLACWVELPTIRVRDNLYLEPHVFSVRCGRVIVTEGEARSVEELIAGIERFYSPTASELSRDISPGTDHS